jgi:putative endopeptidase
MKGSDLLHTYSAIPWEAIFQSTHGWTRSRLNDQTILVLSKRWLKHVNQWCKHLTLDLWKTWLASSIILHFLPLLPPPYDDLEFQLFGKRLRGQSEKMPQKRLALRLAQEWLKGSLGHEYVKEFIKPKVKADALSIAHEIRTVAAERAGATDWLEPATRRIAANKVTNIYLGVGYPKVIQKDQKTLLDSEQLIKNVIRLSELDFQDEMKKVNRPLHREQWDDAVFAVNAYYYNEGNRLILPSGILQWPFFDTHASDGWNFGGLGATIGHEICHAFDNDGKDYDQFGNKNPWWSRAESKRYRQKTNALIELYNKTEYFGHKLNGFLTLSENIADLGGVAISLAALKKRLQAKKVSPQVYKQEICDFFVSFAVSWRTKEKKEKAIQSLFMDVHAPPQARVNNIVSQFDDWYECFNIQPGHPLYKALEKRIRIF